MSTSATLSLSSDACIGSDTDTHGIRVVVFPSFVPDHSDSIMRRFVFAYRIRITNSGPKAARLLSRRWRIVDSHGSEEEVIGDGVVGQQPRLEPGQTHEYSSFCPLRTPWGTMEGHYTFRTDDDGSGGETFHAQIGRFYLVSPEAHKR